MIYVCICYLNGKVTKEEGINRKRPSTQWFIPQMSTATKSGLGWSPEPTTHILLLHMNATDSAFGHLSPPSQLNYQEADTEVEKHGFQSALFWDPGIGGGNLTWRTKTLVPKRMFIYCLIQYKVWHNFAQMILKAPYKMYFIYTLHIT